MTALPWIDVYTHHLWKGQFDLIEFYKVDILLFSKNTHMYLFALNNRTYNSAPKWQNTTWISSKMNKSITCDSDKIQKYIIPFWKQNHMFLVEISIGNFLAVIPRLSLQFIDGWVPIDHEKIYSTFITWKLLSNIQ